MLLPKEMVAGMAPGSVIVDLAADQGGNCELTKPNRTVEVDGVRIIGAVNLPSTVPFHASQMFGKNVANFVGLLVRDGKLAVDLEDDVVRDSMVCQDGEIVHTRVREALGVPPVPAAEEVRG
jgi:NAD(P) transhydrogenase subunit alpha